MTAGHDVTQARGQNVIVPRRRDRRGTGLLSPFAEARPLHGSRPKSQMEGRGRLGSSRGARALAMVLLSACDPPEQVDEAFDPLTPTEGQAEQASSPVVDENAGAATPEAPIGPCAEADATSPLVLELLATLASEDAEQARAVVRDPESGTVATYRTGESIRDGVVLAAVDSGCVVLERDGRRERLAMDGGGTTRLQPGDVFYPDLVEPDDRSGSMADAIPLEEGPGYVVKRPAHAWGTPKTIGVLRDAIRNFRRRHGSAPDVHVGDISLRNGGPFPPHLSHQTGRDVDIGYVLRGFQAHETRFTTATSRNLDLERTWDLLQSLLRTGEVSYVFIDYEIQRLVYDHAISQGADRSELDLLFQYPRGSWAAHGKIRHWKGHDDHLHVRFRK